MSVNTNVIHERDEVRAMDTLAARLAHARALRGISQDELAKAAGVVQGTIANAESGWRKNPRELQAIADALKVRYRWLRYGELPMEESEDLLAEIRALRNEAKDDDQVVIKQLAVQGSMGRGALPPDHIEVVQNVVASVAELRKQCSFSAPQNLQIITGFGRSMYPTFVDGDPLLVDTGVKIVDIDAIYVFEFDGELFIKGIQRVPGRGLKVISHNRDENDPWEIAPEDMPRLLVRGRVVLAWNARRL